MQNLALGRLLIKAHTHLQMIFAMLWFDDGGVDEQNQQSKPYILSLATITVTKTKAKNFSHDSPKSTSRSRFHSKRCLHWWTNVTSSIDSRRIKSKRAVTPTTKMTRLSKRSSIASSRIIHSRSSVESFQVSTRKLHSSTIILKKSDYEQIVSITHIIWYIAACAYCTRTSTIVYWDMKCDIEISR